MPSKQFVLISILILLVLNTVIIGAGAYWGHTGLFEFGASTGKVVWGAVVGAAASVLARN